VRSIGVGVPSAWLALSAAELSGGPLLAAASTAAAFALTAIMVRPIVETLVREREASADTLAGAVFGYLIIARAFAQAHGGIEALLPGSYAGPAPLLGSDLLHFSLVTLTTLGYGDVRPASPAARLLAGAEAVIGVLYVAVLIGRVVAAVSATATAGSSCNAVRTAAAAAAAPPKALPITEVTEKRSDSASPGWRSMVAVVISTTKAGTPPAVSQRCRGSSTASARLARRAAARGAPAASAGGGGAPTGRGKRAWAR